MNEIEVTKFETIIESEGLSKGVFTEDCQVQYSLDKKIINKGTRITFMGLGKGKNAIVSNGGILLSLCMQGSLV